MFFFFFFFKQKTAYEIRPCDWSSDVCSSDLAVDELVQCMGEQVAITDRSKKRQGGHDRLGHHPSHHRLRYESRREPPQPPAGAAELRHDGFLRQRDERAQRLDAELQQPAMCVGVEWENGEPLGGEKFPLLPGANDDRSAGFRTARRDPGDEFSATPPNAECGMRSAEFQGRVVRLTTLTLTFRIPHSALRIW